jgi:glycine/sarcosine N-methyltransferase
MSRNKTNSDILNYIANKIEPSPLKTYVYSEIERIHDEILSKINKGIKIKQQDLDPFVRALFNSGKGKYIGIESNLPSSYFKNYPTFLANHKQYFEVNKSGGKRILIEKDWVGIYNDALMNPGLYKKFIDWHQNNKVDLMWITEDKANILRKEAGLDTTDVGFWPESFAVTFKANSDGTEDIKMISKGSSQFEKIKKYIDTVCKEAQLIPVRELEIPLLPESITRKWEGYVGTASKREETVGKLLLEELIEFKNFRGRVLDAAAGIGHEALFLAKNNFDIAVNELDSGYREILADKTSKQKIDIYNYDWRELTNYLCPVYQAVFLIGNSLSMVKGVEERRKCIKEFFKLLAPGGKLIIDERNFDLIKQTLSKNQEYKGNGIMYPGTLIESKLSRVNSSNLIAFNFYHAGGKSQIGTLVVEALERNELKDMLKEEGFKDIKIYSDLKSGFSPNAHFFTYVAVKPN